MKSYPLPSHCRGSWAALLRLRVDKVDWLHRPLGRNQQSWIDWPDDRSPCSARVGVRGGSGVTRERERERERESGCKPWQRRGATARSGGGDEERRRGVAAAARSSGEPPAESGEECRAAQTGSRDGRLDRPLAPRDYQPFGIDWTLQLVWNDRCLTCTSCASTGAGAGMCLLN